MRLSAEDYHWINDQLKGYKIQYQEIHDELFDHIVSDIEQHREEGNTASVEALYQHIIFQFGGKEGIERIAKAQAKAYQQRVGREFWKIYGNYLDWKGIACVLIISVASLYLPPVAMISKMLITIAFINAVWLIIYAFAKMRSVKVNKGKRSMMTSYMMVISVLPNSLISLLLNIPADIEDLFRKTNHIKSFINTHPVIPAFLLIWVLIYRMSYFKLFRQELAKRPAL